MKTKNVVIFGVSAIVIMLAIVGMFFYLDAQKDFQSELKLREDQNNSLALQLYERDSLVNEYVDAMNQIESDLTLIKEKENLLDTQSQNPEFKKTSKDRISQDIELIYSLIDKNKKKVAALSSKLKKSGIEIKALNEKIALLSDAIAERDQSIEALNDELVKQKVVVGRLNEHIADVEKTVNNQQNIIAEQTQDLNKAYIAHGDYKLLKQKGIIEKEGGFLGLGQNLTMKDDFEQQNFEQIDITKTTTIPVNAKKAELITEHPAGSYEWVKEDEQIAYMVINDPKEFWKVSKYAVVETK